MRADGRIEAVTLAEAAVEQRDAFTTLAAEHSPALLGYIARRVSVRESAPEVLNDALLIAWQKRARLPLDPEQARMWLFVVARNCIRNHERATRRRHVHESPLDELADVIVANDESGADVRSLVLALPPKYRELVMLVHWDGFTIVAAAHLLGVSDSTARTRYGRARERLRAAIEGAGAMPRP